ncbi:hypothetical protein ACLB1Q_08690 [Escherichia coli]
MIPLEKQRFIRHESGGDFILCWCNVIVWQLSGKVIRGVEHSCPEMISNPGIAGVFALAKATLTFLTVALQGNYPALSIKLKRSRVRGLLIQAGTFYRELNLTVAIEMDQ